jgi:Flp pilus assembly protein TadD
MSLAYAVQNGASGSEVLQSLALAQIKLDHTLQAKISIKKLLEKNPSDTVALELQSMLPQE